MKITFSITDDNGHTYNGSTTLMPIGKQPRNSNKTPNRITTAKSEMSFDQNPRAFMKNFATERSGAEKFAILTARLAKGDCSQAVSLAEIKKTWGKMTGIIGKFNDAFSIRAKDSGWVDSPKTGQYVLTPTWKEALQN